MAREINDPPMPNMPAMTSSPEVLRESIPRTDITIPSNTSIAILVAKNKIIRNTLFPPFSNN
jgi:hypothetical protein